VGVKGFQAQAPLAKELGDQMKVAVKSSSAESVSPVMAGPAKVARALAIPFALVYGLRKRAAVSRPPVPPSFTCKPTTRKSRFGDSLDF
jgi:hypothetical protein